MLFGKIFMVRLTVTVQDDPNKFAEAAKMLRSMADTLEQKLGPSRPTLPAFTLNGGGRIYEWWHDDTKNWRL